MGNMLRFPSVVFNNHGLQWFVPYLMAVIIIAIPGLILEVSIGQAYRGGSVIAYNGMNKRLKGTGLSLLFIGFMVLTYFNVIVTWIMVFFRHSFSNPLPWSDRDPEEFFMQDVLRVVPPVEGSPYATYPSIAMIGELAGWCAFVWFLVWICIFQGVGWTGRVVYFTMGMPIIMGIVLVGRGVSLDNAGDGVRLYFATWRGDQLAQQSVWQAACGQVFFSTGVGFGYYTAYASYNRKFANAVQDALIVVTSNVTFEIFIAFGVFGIVGYLGLHPDNTEISGSFDIGFVTFPAALSAMPGANFWSVIWFLTLLVLGISSAFAMLDAVVTLVMDSNPRMKRPLVVTALVTLCYLVSLPYCTEFGYYLLNNIDAWVNNLALVFVVWAECVAATTIYRWKDVVNQVGFPAFIWYNTGYFSGMILGVVLGHAVSAPAGAGLGFGLFIIGTLVAVFKSLNPDAAVPSFWGRNLFLRRLWFLAFYSGNQLRRDLNIIVGTGKNWNIPVFWAPLLRYITAPILTIVLSFAYPDFYQQRYDPLHIIGFTIAHFSLLMVGLGFIAPRWFDVFVPVQRRGEGDIATVPNLESGVVDALRDGEMGSGEGYREAGERSRDTVANSIENDDKYSEREEEKKVIR